MRRRIGHGSMWVVRWSRLDCCLSLPCGSPVPVFFLFWAPAAYPRRRAARFPPIRVTIPWRRRCDNFCMASEIDSLQDRVDAIRATGDVDLAVATDFLPSGVECKICFPLLESVPPHTV